ncbi:hypothetical protein HOG17_05590 [Candidatus Peregrinibacteria bacterium]|mgnify:CR=1|jgi:hypothetical protein|nr:hypothetical protein [Candidatus Peregrinibacteria bacterium]MBT4148025.1 hypothetical protein [Candidatus Peregrinibacteria bacterium]MBT4455600.1 hypothetical protein [Candidatus Peregrinibacteria bacterium]
MKKLIAISLITLFSLTGCFGTPADEEETDNTNQMYSTYKSSDISIIYPNDWEVLNSSDFTSNVPASTVVVFRNNLKNDIFTANLNISQAEIPLGTNNEDFALQTLNTQKYNLVGFTELLRENYNIKTGEETEESTVLSTFQGRKTITESLVEFKQTYIARNGFGIIVTAAYLPNEEQSVVMMLDEMLRSFALKSSS